MKTIFFKNTWRKILNAILPNRCLTCNCLIGEDGLFCVDDFKKLQFISDPKCKICSYPFEHNWDLKGEILCPQCVKTRPNFDESVVIFCYNDALKKVFLGLKYYDDTVTAKKFGEFLAGKILPIASNYDLIAPVPLHKKRLKQRKFNQAGLLGKIIGKKTGIKICVDLLVRTKFIKSQANLNKDERRKNLHNAFKINEKYRDAIFGKNILLIDDVMASGSTLDECAKTLKKAGVKKVTVGIIAKTVFDN